VTTVDDLLTRLVEDAAYHSGPEHAPGIRAMCEALALLRPRVPVDVLVRLCGVPASLVRSFAADLSGSLLADGDALQFLNEPTETWFRSQFRPEGDALRAFVARLLPLASGSGYVAASLPPLMWECGDFDELVRLALADEALPAGNDIERQQVAQQRLQFALKAALRQRAYLHATRLALRAGAHGAGHSRRLRLLRDNSDLAGSFLDPQAIEDLVAARDLAGKWPNSSLLHEGALLSFAPSQLDYARSRLRSAIEWTVAWVNAPRAEHESHDVAADDIAEIAIGLLNVDGAAAAVEFLQRWRPEDIAAKPAALITARLAQQGRAEAIRDLLRAERASEHVLLGVASSAAQAGLMLDSPALERCVAMLRDRDEPVSLPDAFHVRDDDPDVLLAVCWIVALGTRHGLLTRLEAQGILVPYLPTVLRASAGSWWGSDGSRSVIGGLALLACLRGEAFDIRAVTPVEVTEAAERPAGPSREASEFAANVVPFAGWAALWAQVMLGEAEDADAEFMRLAGKTLKGASDYQTPRMFINAVAGTGSLLLAAGSSEASRAQFAQWVRSNYRFVSRRALTEIVQHSAGSPELHGVALEVAEIIAAEVAASHDGADERIGDLVRLSRAIFRLSEDESREYFLQAMKAAEIVGDDIHARWNTLLKISEAASRGDVPDRARAYRLAQVAESLDPYLGDAFDGEDALRAIGKLDPGEGIAVASRWRDRRVCRLDRAVEALAVRDDCVLASMPLSCIAMTLLQQRPDILQAVRHAAGRRPTSAQVIADTIAALPRAVVGAQPVLEVLRAAAAESGTALDGTSLDRHEEPRHPGYEETGRTDWDRQDASRASARTAALGKLSELDLASPDGIIAARTLCHDTPLTWKDVTDAALSYPTAVLAQVIRAMTASPALSSFDYQEVLTGLRSRVPLPLSAKTAVREMTLSLATRFCASMTTMSYDPIDLDALKAAAGQDIDPLGIALEELGRHPETLAGEACFALASRLGARLSPEEAHHAFDDATGQYQDIAPADAADGLIGDLPAPPGSTAACVAGFLWAALGDPAIATRWRAAHAVCALISLREAAVLEELARYASGELPSGPFVDRRLHFYDRHALLWLLLAVERSAASPDRPGLQPLVPFLLATAANDQDHVLVRQSARNTLLALHATGLVSLGPAFLVTLEAANRPVGRRPGRSPVAPAPVHSSDHLRFFFDFDKYWCSGLAEAFGLPVRDVVRMASEVTDARWHFTAGIRQEDERHSRRLYRDEATWGHGSEWPKEDDLGRYLGFHSLMTVAGRLIRQQPVYDGDPGEASPFDSWLQGFRPSRPDGRWLADRRDAAPRPVLPLTLSKEERDDWELSLSAGDFETCLSADNGWVTVWEASTEQHYDQSQDIQVSSALADTVHSRALAAALQTADSYHGFRLPTTGDDEYTFDESGYRLTGWIATPYARDGLDTYDPLAARITFPPPRLSRELATQLGLTADEDMREWRRGDTVVMRSTDWDDSDGRRENSPGGPSGHRLEIRQDILAELLRLTDSHLIVTIMIDRNYSQRWRRQDGDASERFPYREKSYRVFAIGTGEHGVSLHFGHRTRQGTSKGTRPV
jgi:hypothetical protein